LGAGVKRACPIIAVGLAVAAPACSAPIFSRGGGDDARAASLASATHAVGPAATAPRESAASSSPTAYLTAWAAATSTPVPSATAAPTEAPSLTPTPTYRAASTVAATATPTSPPVATSSPTMSLDCAVLPTGTLSLSGRVILSCRSRWDVPSLAIRVSLPTPGRSRLPISRSNAGR
jgi:hypothetical protein